MGKNSPNFSAFEKSVCAVPDRARRLTRARKTERQRISTRPRLQVVAGFRDARRHFNYPSVAFLKDMLKRNDMGTKVLFRRFPFCDLLGNAPRGLVGQASYAKKGGLILPLPAREIDDLVFRRPLVVPLSRADKSVLRLRQTSRQDCMVNGRYDIYLVN